MADTILVTGAAGTVGSRTVSKLIAAGGARVLAGVHHAEKAGALADAGAHLLELDLDDPGSVAQAVAAADTIFLITPPHLGQAQMVQNVLSAAKASRIRRIVRLSVMGAEAEPAITLRRIHRSCELAIMGSNIDWTFLRPNGFMQNFEAYKDVVRRDGTIYMPLGDSRVSYIDVDDVARVAATVLLDTIGHYSGAAFEMTGPAALSRTDVAGMFNEVLGKQVRFENAPDDAAREAMISGGVPSGMAQALIELFADYRRGAGEATTTAVADITGTPARSFGEYLQYNRQAYR